jgi:formate--tetrahydrofolate ligase
VKHDQHKNPKSDIAIAQESQMKPIADVAREKLGIPANDLLLFGHYKAKLALDYIQRCADRPQGKLILVTSITPTAAGEGKTTTTVGLGDAFNRLGKRAMICLRQPSLGPSFGAKGGAAGGGYAQVLPMEDINLHFTGDFHAIGAANNLLAALIDNHIYWGNQLGMDPRRVTWRRAVDLNDRALREIVSSLGGVTNGFPREDGFDIVPASEIMAVFCLAENLMDLKRRLGRIIVGYKREQRPVTASDLEAAGALTALLKDAFAPNLVQTIENNPAFVHGGPFANIAHGCNSVIATKTALRLSDYVITEAGFGTDLGAEKFMDIKCRKAGLRPDCAVIVATIRALKMHGGAARDALGQENLAALEKGFANLARHIDNVRKFGVPAVVCVNRFSADTDEENAMLKKLCETAAVDCVTADHWAEGGAGAIELAKTILNTLANKPARFEFLYPDDMPLWKKAQIIAREMYGADDVIGDQKIRDRFRELQDQGYGQFPVCVAKTEFSLTTDRDKKGAPKHHVVPIREVRLAAGAEFIVAICGDIMTMPGLPKVPAAGKIDVTTDGTITGLS